MIDDGQIREFQDTVWEYYCEHGRHDLPWRQSLSDGRFDPYRILVSELMLQQTQVQRVMPKYAAFLQQFPTVHQLAQAELGAVLRAWSGLGYNRRAKYLHEAARVISRQTDFPRTQVALTSLPGVGVNTAGAILAYAYNKPVVFIETNIRTVYIHHFFQDQQGIADSAVREVLHQTVDTEHPREWYWALMDYGSHLKREVGNLNMLSNTYAKQSKFEGSRRQIRGKILRVLGKQSLTQTELLTLIDDDRTASIVNELLAENMIREVHNKLSL